MKKENFFLIFSIIVILLGGGFFLREGKIYIEKKREEEIKKIIDCFSQKDIKLYLISESNFCQEQKEIFKNYIGYLKIVYCDTKENQEDCFQKKINSFPTWVVSADNDSVIKNLISCQECRKKSENFVCEDLCYTKTEDGKFLKVIGEIKDLSLAKKIFGCQDKK